MILYCSSIDKFISDVSNKKIINILDKLMKTKLFHHSSKSEETSWEKSLEYMSTIISNCNMPNDVTIVLEYNLPISSFRVDLIITGYDELNVEKVLLFELKQWSKVNLVENSDILLETYVGNGLKKVVHPSYQVLTYKDLLCDYNKYVQEKKVLVVPCVVMHNYIKDGIIDSGIFSKITKNVNIFYKDDYNELVNYLNKSFVKGDNQKIIKKIDSSIFVPSIKLQDTVCNLIKGNKCFKLLDNQMVIYHELLKIVDINDSSVSIIDGGPGTGKSVLAINLLSELIKKGKMTQYVSRNTAPRSVYSYNLKGTMNKNNIDNLFKTSGSYTSMAEDIFDCLIIDEAQCLTEKSGLFNNYGENQIKEIIKASKHTIFFIDERQKVHLNDIGTIQEIEKWSKNFNKKINRFSLISQFRCNGSNDYINFVDYILGIKNKFDGSINNYDFKIYDSPSELKNAIVEKNKFYKSRVLSGYCWNWNKDEINNSNYHDIKINDFGISWNLGMKQTYAIDDSIDEAGCIHSVQGLEFDYVGVIIGPDLAYDGTKLITNFHNHASTDPSFRGIKKIEKENYEYAQVLADELIKNAYRVLLTRGMKGCYVYCTDDRLGSYYKKILGVLKKD